MTDALLAAIQTDRAWLDRFTRREYGKAFKAYKEQFAPAYLEAVRAREEDPDALGALAEELLDGLEAGWRRRHFWNRGAVKVNEKQMLVDFLSPMLLDLEEPGCEQLAERLRQGWEARWPRDAYRTATYAQLQNGFRNSILGIDLANKHMDPERDR